MSAFEQRDFAKVAADVARDGYVHVCDGLSPAFLDCLRRTASALSVAPRSQLLLVKGRKDQWLYEFPCDQIRGEMIELAAAVLDVPAARITISERHFKRYPRNSEARPPLHKDRAASSLAVGIPVATSPVSRLALMPTERREPNVGNTAVYLDEAPAPATLTLLDIRPGDFVVFQGSSMFHERYSASGDMLLYIKFNTDGRDPLGEHI